MSTGHFFAPAFCAFRLASYLHKIPPQKIAGYMGVIRKNIREYRMKYMIITISLLYAYQALSATSIEDTNNDCSFNVTSHPATTTPDGRFLNMRGGQTKVEFDCMPRIINSEESYIEGDFEQIRESMRPSNIK